MNHVDIRALDAILRSLVVDERKALVRFLRHLDVLDREQAYAPRSTAARPSSTWSESSTFRRAPPGPG